MFWIVALHTNASQSVFFPRNRKGKKKREKMEGRGRRRRSVWRDSPTAKSRGKAFPVAHELPPPVGPTHARVGPPAPSSSLPSVSLSPPLPLTLAVALAHPEEGEAHHSHSPAGAASHQMLLYLPLSLLLPICLKAILGVACDLTRNN